MNERAEMNTKDAVLDILFDVLREHSRESTETVSAISEAIAMVGKDIGCKTCIWASDRECVRTDTNRSEWCGSYEMDAAKMRWRQ